MAFFGRRRPLCGIDVVFAEHEFVRYMHAQNLDFGCNSSAKFSEALPFHLVQLSDSRFHVHGTFQYPRRWHDFAGQPG